MVAPLIGAAAIGAGSDIIGSILGASSSKAPSKYMENLEQMLGQRGLDIQSASVANQLVQQLQNMPEKDRALYMLNARLGQSPDRFQPSGVFQQAGATPSQGGIDFNAMKQAASNYTPGAGGTRPDLQALMLNRLGYSPQGGSAFGTPGQGNAWQQSLGQQFSVPTISWGNLGLNTNTGNFTLPKAGSPSNKTPGDITGLVSGSQLPQGAAQAPQAQQQPNAQSKYAQLAQRMGY